MKIKHLGKWTPYRPDLPAEDIRAAMNVMFLKNEDGQDWYESAAHNPDTKTKSGFLTTDDGKIIMVGCELERMCPRDLHAYVIEDVDFASDADMTHLLGQIADRATNTLLPAPPLIPVSITRRQCARALRARDLITNNEMIAMTQTGVPPAMVLQALNAIPDEDARAVAITDFAADTYMRDNPLLNQLMTATGATPTDIDAFFIFAATL